MEESFLNCLQLLVTIPREYSFQIFWRDLVDRQILPFN